jgi:hypothetical protein
MENLHLFADEESSSTDVTYVAIFVKKFDQIQKLLIFKK